MSKPGLCPAGVLIHFMTQANPTDLGELNEGPRAGVKHGRLKGQETYCLSGRWSSQKGDTIRSVALKEHATWLDNPELAGRAIPS